MAGNSFFNKIFGKKNISVLGVDIGSSSIKVVQLRRKNGKAILETYGEISLGPYVEKSVGQATRMTPEQLSEALTDVLKEAHITTRNASVTIPMRHSMVSLIKMPEMEEKQLKKMVPIEARKYIPVPITEVALDWFIVPKITEDTPANKIPQKEILIVAIHNNILNDYNSIVANTQLQTQFFEIEMFSTIRAIMDSGETRPVMIFDMGAGATKLYIIERGIIRDTHTINRGSQEISMNISRALGVSVEHAEKMKRNYGNNDLEKDKQIKEIIDLVITPIFREANSVVVNYERQQNRSIGKIILIGGGVMLEGFQEKAQESFRVETQLGDPFGKVEAPAFLQQVLKKTGLAFSGALGLALRLLQDAS